MEEEVALAPSLLPQEVNPNARAAIKGRAKIFFIVEGMLMLLLAAEWTAHPALED
jgi:hypothetical protein